MATSTTKLPVKRIYRVLWSKRTNFVLYKIFSRKCTKRVHFEFMGGDNKHLYSFVESHMSRDLGVSLAIASLSELIWEHLLVVISSANASQELKIKLNII